MFGAMPVNPSEHMELVSYRTSSTVWAEGVYQFLRGSLYGAVWGLVTPFHAPGSMGAAAEASTGVFKAARPFSSFLSVGHNAAIFGSIMGIQRLSSKSLELARAKDDFYNDVFGFAVTYKYYTTFLGCTERRLVLHNRAVGAMVLAAVVYAGIN